MNKLPDTLQTYLIKGINPDKPRFEKVLATKQNTPIGASFMTSIVISIITELPWVNTAASMSEVLRTLAKTIPIISAKKMIGNMSPLAKDSIGFFGMMFRIVSANLTLSVVAVVAVCAISKFVPSPGFMTLATVNAIIIAIAVVNK